MARRWHLAALLVAVASCSSGAVARAAAGSGGVIATAPGAQLFGVASQSNGEILAAGQAGGRVLVERFTPAGSVDGSFTGPAGFAKAVAVQPDGKIVVAGSSGGVMIVERLTPGLTADGGFGSGGVATAQPGLGAVANAVAIGPDGSIVAAGSVNAGGTTNFGVARFSAGGQRQWSEPLNFGTNSLVSGVAIQPDARIVLVGRNTQLQTTNGVLARLNPDGTPDGSFNGGAFTYHYPGGGFTALTSVALQPNGQIVAGGAALADNSVALVLRLNANGSFDNGFGSGGTFAVTSETNVLLPSDPIGVYGVAVAGGGRIVAAGNFENTGTDVDAAQWAVTPGGALDSSFGNGGTLRGPVGGYEACAIAVAPDGSLDVVGNTASAPDPTPCSAAGSGNAFVARYAGFGPPPAPGPAPGPPSAQGAPSAVTGAASHVGQLRASVSGQVNANGLPTAYRFQYGTSTAYGSSTPVASAGAGGAAGSVSAALTGLKPATTYHYRVVAVNSRGSADGVDRSFRTRPLLRSKLSRLRSSFALAGALAKGLSLHAACNQACSVKGSLIISAQQARQLKLGNRSTRIARGSSSLGQAGTVSVVLRFTTAAKLALSSSGTVNVSLKVLVSPGGGGRSVALHKIITLRR